MYCGKQRCLKAVSNSAHNQLPPCYNSANNKKGLGFVRISIHTEPYAGALGGSEYTAAILAGGLCPEHAVTLHHPHAGLTLEKLEAFAKVPLPKVALQFVPFQRGSLGTSGNPFVRYRESRAWRAELSRGYDALFTFTHGYPPFCYAKVGVLTILFPAGDRWQSWPWSAERPEAHSLRRWIRRQFTEWDWQQRLASYRHKVAISEFTRQWSRRWWGVESSVIYPPVETRFRQTEKRNLILSVGRFTGNMRPKNQWEMLQAFAEMTSAREVGWNYWTFGSLANDPADQAYFQRVAQLAESNHSEARANAPRSELIAAYETAKIYWHAGGLGVDESQSPWLSEHFGITPVEAMAAGCVPIVINRGGLRETVEHGISGFLWNTVDELKFYTERLIQDRTLLERMSAAARERAQQFSRERFVASYQLLLER